MKWENNSQINNQSIFRIITHLLAYAELLYLLFCIVAFGLIFTGNALFGWLVFIISSMMFGIIVYYFLEVEGSVGTYLCPNCNTHFMPDKKANLLGAHHRNTTKKLVCPSCYKTGYCKKEI